MRRNSYSDLIKELKTVKVQDADFGLRLNELISINELLTTLNEAKTLTERLDILLLTVLGQYGCLKGSLYIKANTAWRIGSSKGIRSCPVEPDDLPLDDRWDELPLLLRENNVPDEDTALRGFFGDDRFRLVLPVRNERKLVGMLCLGKSMLPKEAAARKEDTLSIIADFSGVIIGNSLYHEDLEAANRQMQRQLFRLNTLYEITGAFARCYEDEEAFQILGNNLMGQFFISRYGVVAFDEHPQVIFHKGLRKLEPIIGSSSECRPLSDWPMRVLPMSQIQCEPMTRFMASQKLGYALPISSEGNHRGLLLLGERLDRRELSDADMDFIISLAEQAAVALENIRLQKEMLEKKRMEKELQLAREIQQKLIPKGVPDIEGYELAAEMRPYYQVGGDFYDFIPTENGRLVICLADVSGKSLPASMIMSTAQASLRALASFPNIEPCEVVERLNKHLYKSTANNKFITMFYALLDPTTHRLDYINCGHNHPILVRPDRSVENLGLGGMVLGMFPMARYKVGTVQFEPGTELLIYTDGLSEVTNSSGEEYGDERLTELLLNKRGCPCLEDEKNQIVSDVMTFSANEMVDDMTLLMIRRRDHEQGQDTDC